MSFRPEHLLGERLVTSADAAADGTAAWSVRRPLEDGRGYAVELWLRPPDGEPRLVPLPFSPTAAPRFTADGLLLLVGGEGDERRVWLADPAGGEPRAVTEAAQVVAAEPSPVDAAAFAFSAQAGPPRFLVGGDVARRIGSTIVTADGLGFRDHWHHLFLSAGGETAQLTDGDVEVHAFGWAASGGLLWVLVGREAEQPYEVNELWTVAPRAGAEPAVEVAATEGILGAALSPDGRLLAYLVRPQYWEQTRLCVLDRETRETRRLDAGLCVDQSTFPDLLPASTPATQLAWADDGAAVLAIATIRGEPRLQRFPLDAEPEAAAPSLLVGSLRRAAGRTLAVAVSGEAPAEVFELAGGAPRRLSDHGSWLPEGAWPRVSELVAGGSGAEVHGWVFEPRDGAPADAPLLLHVHGGPYGAHCPIPWLEMAALTGRGYRVLAPNPRGSVSYGDGWSGAITGSWGGVDADDLVAFVDAALERGLGAPERVGVLGLSYGGFMTLHLLAASDRFAAGVAENPVASFVSEIGTSDLGALGIRLFLGRDEPDLDALLHGSPLYRYREITAPLLLLHGEADLRCPLPESQQVYTFLRALGREVELVRFPEESHVMFRLARPDRRVYRLECILDWFDRRL